MQFMLSFSLRKKEITTEFRRVMISFIKKALTHDGESRYYEMFFKGTNIKPYTFSVELPKPQFLGNKVILEDTKIRVRFSTTSYRRRELLLYNRLRSMKDIYFPLKDGNSMKLEQLQIFKSPVVRDNQILVKTVVGGGICVRDHHADNTEDYEAIGDKSFEALLNRTIANQLKKAGLQYAKVSVHCVQGERLIVTHFKMKFPITKGFFVLSGERIALQYLLDAGMGSKRSQGFGMIELVRI